MNIDLITFSLVMFLGAITPGPDFIIIFNNSMKFGFKEGMFTILGVVTGLFIHVLIVSLSIKFLMHNHSVYLIFQIFSSLYLSFIAYTIFKAKKVDFTLDLIDKKRKRDCYKDGFLINILNIKATFFITLIYSQFIDTTKSSIELYLLMGFIVILSAIIGFSIVVSIVNINFINKYISNFTYYIEKFMGFILLVIIINNIYNLI